eukprot:2209738-Pleurochrysis_carterae.AAC.2
MFLSVDYALACDVLPSLEHAAQSLGVWGVSAFFGSTLGPLVAGPLLTYVGRTESPESCATPSLSAGACARAYACARACATSPRNVRAGWRGLMPTGVTSYDVTTSSS